MRYAGIIYNDTAAAPGLSLSLYTQGCPLHCKGCHNPETWSMDGGYEYNNNIEQKIIKALNANGVLRKLCILGGEPLIPCNLMDIADLCERAKEEYPELEIYLWSGYEADELFIREMKEENLKRILDVIDILISGPYEEDKRDITLELRGSTNQRIYIFFKDKSEVGKQFGFEQSFGTYYGVMRNEEEG